MDDYNGGLAQVRAQVEVGSVHWDVVDMELADAVRACDEGLLEPIDHNILAPAPDGTPGVGRLSPGDADGMWRGNPVLLHRLRLQRRQHPR